MNDPPLWLVIAVATLVLFAIGICVGLAIGLDAWWERRAHR